MPSTQETVALKTKAGISTFSVLGVNVCAVQMDGAVSQIEEWIVDRGASRYVAFTGMHGVSEAARDARFSEILNSADLVVPDGMPLVWLARWHGHAIRHRVTGSELMTAFCGKTGSRYRHFFYGGAPGVAEDLARTLIRRFGVVVAGTWTPPFRPLTDKEEAEIAKRVREAAPDVLWVGLSTPKQERWMYEHRGRLNVPVMLGVGAAFDMNSGRMRRAPGWMQDCGMEWLFRFLLEPRRLWKRYLVTIPSSFMSVVLELFPADQSE